MKIYIKSPGRVNLIGEHTDYNGGYVLPCALNLSINILLEISPVKSMVITDLGYSMQFDVNDEYRKSDIHWENYVLGVVNELKRVKKKLKNFRCKISSTLPHGAGVSSSSALVCGLIKGLSIINDVKLDNTEIINLSRNVEHKYIGLLGGIMDQFTILNAKKNKAILLNCENLKTEFINLELGKYKLLLIDTNVKHNLANTEYNKRVSECKKSLEIINKERKKDYHNLSQISISDINKSKNKLSKTLYKRVSYVIKENIRTIKSRDLLESKNLVEFGKLMYESHAGLKNDYEVSCKELDFLVEKTKNNEEILGARMMGGGFGGCTVNLVKSSAIKSFINSIEEEYFSKFALRLKTIIADPGSGIIVKKF